MPKRPAAARAPTERALRAAVVPYARRPRDFGLPTALLSLPEDCMLVSGETFRTLTWGGTGHRDTLRLSAPWLTSRVAVAAVCAGDVDELPLEQAAAHQDEWLGVPVAVPKRRPMEGHAYVMTETGERIPEAGELYHRTWIEEGVPPKQVPLAQVEATQADRKAAKAAGRDARKVYGETAPLGIKLRTIKTKGDGDCFFSAICKAFVGHQTCRDPDMWATMRRWERLNRLGPVAPEEAGGSGMSDSSAAGGQAGAPGSASRRAGRRDARRESGAGSDGIDGGAAATAGGPEIVDVDSAQPEEPDEPLSPSEPPTVTELRRCCAAHFCEETWLTCQVVGGTAFAYASEASLDVRASPLGCPRVVLLPRGRARNPHEHVCVLVPARLLTLTAKSTFELHLSPVDSHPGLTAWDTRAAAARHGLTSPRGPFGPHTSAAPDHLPSPGRPTQQTARMCSRLRERCGPFTQAPGAFQRSTCACLGGRVCNQRSRAPRLVQTLVAQLIGPWRLSPHRPPSRRRRGGTSRAQPPPPTVAHPTGLTKSAWHACSAT